MASALLKDYKEKNIADVKSIDSKKHKDYKVVVDIQQNQATKIYQQLRDYLGSKDKHEAIELEFEWLPLHQTIAANEDTLEEAETLTNKLQSLTG